MSTQVSRFIDVARWIAALAVLFTHVEANVLVTLADIPAGHRGAIAYLAWFFYGFAHQAVVVFFVLSGFLVGGGVLRAAPSKRFLGSYLLDRTARIYVVLLPVLAVTALLDAAGRSLFADTGVYAAAEFAGRSSLADLLANVAGLQDIYFPYFGTNSALWTLAHEYWYYVGFALLVMPWARAYSPAARAAGGAAGVALLILLSASWSYHLFGFGLWLAGAAAARLARPLTHSRRLALLVFLAVAIGLRLFLRYAWLEIWWVGGLADAAVALGFANLLLTLRFDASPVGRFAGAPIHRRLSDFSYSLYALHMPVLVFACAAAQHWLGFGWRSVPDAPGRWALAAVVLCCIVALAYAFSRLTEARTPAVRTALRDWLERQRSATPAGAPRGA